MSVTIKDIQVLVDEYADQSYVQGYEAAEARIINLLEERVLTHPEPSHYDLLHNQLVNGLIALIKGENK